MPLRPQDVYPAGATSPPFPLLDVRAPVEVARGALPHARALPLMTDEERHLVGVRYREAGQEAALALGYEVAGPHLAARTAAWRDACAGGPAAVACWRGGLRSRLVVEMIGRDDVHAVAGGYKALRAHLLAGLEDALERKRLVVLTGLTGTGKTALLQSLAGAGAGVLHAVDLEGAARHRGSAFGALDEPQPSQATFENAVAAELVLGAARTVVVEDESRHVGRLVVPAPLLEAMRRAPVAVLELPLEARVARVFDEYVRAPTERDGGAAVRSRLDEALVRLRPRLGGARSAMLRSSLAAAEAAWGDVDAHRPWIAELLQGYYDRRYAKALAGHGRPELARGDAATVRDALLAAAA